MSNVKNQFVVDNTRNAVSRMRNSAAATPSPAISRPSKTSPPPIQKKMQVPSTQEAFHNEPPKTSSRLDTLGTNLDTPGTKRITIRQIGKRMHRPGIEPGAGRHLVQIRRSVRWQRPILPLNHQCYSMVQAAGSPHIMLAFVMCWRMNRYLGDGDAKCSGECDVRLRWDTGRVWETCCWVWEYRRL